MKKTKELCVIAFLSALIVVTGIFKIPGIVPGTEFQLSAPISVAICACFGFKRYFYAGITASLVSFVLGFQNLLNISVSLTFRIFAGLILVAFGNRIIPLIIAGPIGTFFGRVVLSLITNVNLWLLLTAAAIGMLYTAITVFPIYKIMRKIISLTKISEFTISEKQNIFKRQRVKE